MHTINNFKKHLICWGAADQCIVMKPIVESLGSKINLLIDETPNIKTPFPEIELLSGKQQLEKWLKGRDVSDIGFFIAIANPYGFVRCRLHQYLKELGLTAVTVCDPSAVIDKYSVIGEGAQIMRNVIVNAEARIGDQCILNTRSLAEHHDTLGNGVELAPGAVLCGRVSVGNYSFVCANATVIPRVRIGQDSIIGAGAVVCHDVGDEEVVTGVPAKFLKKNNIISGATQ